MTHSSDLGKPKTDIPAQTVSTDRTWKVTCWMDGPATGPRNMAVDDWLLREAVERGAMVLRFYRWSEPTLSLGYFQRLAGRDAHAASWPLPIVRRATGGGALVHDRELTYSLVLPAQHPRAAKACCLYDLLHSQLVAVLAESGIDACLHRDMPATRVEGCQRRASPFLCFERRAGVDVVINGTKIAGSAQRRHHGAVLQHGSVLLGRSPAAPELPGIRELTGKNIRPYILARQWSQRIARQLNAVLESTSKPRILDKPIERLIADRYGSPAWTARRP